jgi:serine/threonine-protein kinase
MKPGESFDRYSILRRIGYGGMGDVYRAHDTRLHRSVALKILRPDALEVDGEPRTKAEAVERMFREARAAAALDHPNVVVVFDVGEVTLPGASEPSYFIAMEYVDGVALRTLIGKTDVPLEDRIRWLVDVAHALEFAHERGIIHRDVKPENIMIRTDGVVKVLDFGIARRARAASPAVGADPLSTLTEKGVAMGTPRYMAPEQMLGEELDGRADQYAWAVMGYELLAGSAPWPGAPDSLQLLAQALIRDPQPLRERAPDVPAEVAAVIERALSRDRSERFLSLSAVLEALGEAGPSAPAPTKKQGVIGPPSSQRSSSQRLPQSQRSAPTSLSMPVPPPMEPVEPAPPETATLRGHHSTRRAQVVKKRTARPFLYGAGAAMGAAAIVVAGGLLRGRAPPTSTASSPAAAPTCEGSAKCTARLGAPAVCGRAGACVPLVSEDCEAVAEPADLSNDATVWVGTMFPLTGPDAKAWGLREFRAVELARRDFAQILAGSKARPHGTHPIAVLSCDDAADSRRALHHLVDEVGVPAVIGFRTSNEAIEAATSSLIPSGVLTVAALNTSPMLSSLPQPQGQPRLVWRTTYSAAEMALPIAQLVPEVLEPELRPRLGANPLRVAIVRQDDATGLGFADALFRNLKFNGRSALENESSYHEFVSSLGAGDDPAEYDKLVPKLAAFAPHVIVFFGSDESLVHVAGALERGWHDPVRPRYVRTSPLGPLVHQFIGTSADRRRRFLSLTTVSTTPANARFVVRYNEAFGEGVTRTLSPNSSYDAFYLVAYATHALGDAPVTGVGLASAIPRLTPPGPRIDVGPSGIFDVIRQLAGGGRVDLNGATGPLDFDPSTGDARVDLAVLCVDVDGRGVASGNRESGLVFEAMSGALRGALKCP